ncbi:hypothetical protein HMPREF0083_05640 [Aneurinibacillus aneurinilyticus ATCC 12856]|uniref:Uncharacterized protein n=1 Tax=Aneurinibacillus aneurinilyticus ATCC 12856 TaxID=649747 RepID=U1WTJ1_ANEAE|nr:hypothetical protein HMPREF0083_05640 [Aneurinibacillus aneurinilyticus ATCC 12856]
MICLGQAVCVRKNILNIEHSLTYLFLFVGTSCPPIFCIKHFEDEEIHSLQSMLKNPLIYQRVL